MQTETLTPADRSALRRAILATGAGIKTAGMSDDELRKAAQVAGVDEHKAQGERDVERALEQHGDEQAESEPETPPQRRRRRRPAVDAPEEPQKPATPSIGHGQDIGQAIGAVVTEAIQNALGQAPQSVDEATIIRLIHEHATVTHTIRVPAHGDIPETEIKGAHECMPTVMATLKAAKVAGTGWPLLAGPAGSGKTTIAEQIADAWGLPFFSTGAVHQKYELTGFVNAQGDYQDTVLYRCLVSGGVFLFDEFDDSIATATVAFNQMLGNGGMTFPNGEFVQAHKDCYFIAAANTSGTGPTKQYIGRNPLDGATLDRFFEVEVSYDLAIETNRALMAFRAAGGTDETQAQRWIERVREVRHTAESEGWHAIISPRASITGAALIAQGIDKRIVEHGTLLKHLTKDQRKRLGA